MADSSDMKIAAFRLTTGQDLRKGIEEQAGARNFDSSFVLSCVGGLSSANLRMPGANKRLELFDDLEIVSLTGTLSPDGGHLHGAFSDIDGNVVGGHIMDGCIVRLTAEVVLGCRAGLTFAREFDPQTGFAEICIQDQLL
jgi:predicted DNA-binding protein with PD1-like motif